MHYIKQCIFTVIISILFIACTKKEKQEEIVVNEYLEVEAICIQNNNNIKVLFTGYLAHIYNKTQNSGFRHGNLTYNKTINNTDKNYSHPSKVKFSKIPAKTFSKSHMNLTGLSYSSINRDVFKTNCEVKVIKRLDHLPK